MRGRLVDDALGLLGVEVLLDVLRVDERGDSGGGELGRVDPFATMFVVWVGSQALASFIICWDFVSNPSTHGAFMHPKGINESKQHIYTSNKYDKVNDIINEMLCDLTCKCSFY